MRHILFAALLSTSLLLSHTAVQAQEKGLDEFEAFRNKLNANRGMGLPAPNKAGYGATPQTPEELQAMMQQEQDDVRMKFVQQALKTADSVLKKNEPVSEDLKDKIIADGKITNVVVYGDRAKVTRTAVVEIPAGKSTIAFTEISPDMLPNSLRAEGHADVEVKFGAVSQKKIFLAGPSSPRLVELYLKYEPLLDQKAMIGAERFALRSKRSFISGLGQQAAQSVNEEFKRNDLKPEQWEAAANSIEKANLDINKAELALDVKERDLDREIEKARSELMQFGSIGARNYAVMVPLETASATKLTIELSYQVRNATWFPLYDARLDTKGENPLQIVQYGVVQQKTGEDWRNVTLSLSTARPQQSAVLPILRPIWIDAELVSDLAVPPQPTGTADPLAEWRQKAEARRLSLESETAPPESEETEAAPVPMVTPIRPVDGYRAQLTPAIIETGGYVSEYKIQGPANVLSDGSETKLMIGNFDAQSELQVHVKPQQSTNAYLVAQMKLKGDAPILPGTVNLFRDGAFIGPGNIPLLRPDEEYDLSFGLDDQVLVKHNTLKDENKEEGMISKDNVIERQYVTEIENLHNEPVKVVVMEMVPTSKNEKVSIDVRKDFTGAGYAMDVKNIKGLMQWKFDMPAKSKKELKLGWRVIWPKDHRLKGL